MVEEIVYIGFHQDVRLRLATGALVRADVPDDGSDAERAQGDPVAVYLPADGLRVLEADE
jgi:TOBE domain